MMETDADPPIVVVVGGPNGAGKTTSATRFLPQGLDLRHYVNADTIAAGLSAFAPEEVALQAGRVMLARLEELARTRQSFAFETTLASRTFAPFLRKLKATGYKLHVAYVWLEPPSLAVERVASRVARGGHHIPAETIARRYWRGLANFRTLYRPIADSWLVCDNTSDALRHLAIGTASKVEWILDRERYDEFERTYEPGS